MAEEFPVGGGKTIDLVATRDGKRIAFEVETGESDTAANVQKCFDAGLEKIVVVTTSSRIQEALRKVMSQNPRVEILRGEDVLQREWQHDAPEPHDRSWRTYADTSDRPNE